MILLLDTSTPVCHITIYKDGQSSEYEWQAERGLAKGLLGYIEECLGKTGGKITDISGLGVFKGPGSFTGLRIGITVLNTIASVQTVPIVGAAGTDWKEVALQRLNLGEDDKIVLPEYGSAATITKPRK